MVNDGRPSRGCQMCRTRRIKCDETKPVCNRCTESRRTCPGYKNEVDLIFRHKTLETEQKALKANEPKKGKKNSPVKPRPLPVATTTLVAAPKVPIEEQAACHFFANFVVAPHKTDAAGFMKFMYPLMTAKTIPDHLKYSFDACALASLNNRRNTGDRYGRTSVQLYSKALSTTHAALRDPKAGTTDATLVSILLMALFENITATRVDNLAWGTHIEGAIELVKARGRGQMQTEQGLAMLQSVRRAMITHSLGTGVQMGAGIDWWDGGSAALDDADARCQQLALMTADIKGEANRLLSALPRPPDFATKAASIIDRCYTLDRACANWEKTIPEHYHYSTIAQRDEEPDRNYMDVDIYPGHVDTYSDLSSTAVWGMQRCARIGLMNIILRCAASVSGTADYWSLPDYKFASRIFERSLKDLIAAVPYQLSTPLKGPGLREVDTKAKWVDEDGPVGLGGFFATWCLATIYVMDVTSPAQRSWIKGRLRHITSRLGVRFAQTVIQLNLRVPSMLVLADGRASGANLRANGLDRLVAAKNHLYTVHRPA